MISRQAITVHFLNVVNCGDILQDDPRKFKDLLHAIGKHDYDVTFNRW